ncbi:hypothetical protein Aperf_G00000123068 [Anoplocephala perfoliata]
MRLRLKLGNQFKVADVGEDALLGALIKEAAILFSSTINDLSISLNSTDFYSSSDGRTRLRDIGVVSGDIIYVKSNVQADDIKRVSSLEALRNISDSIKNFGSPFENSGVRITLYPLDVTAQRKGLKDPFVIESTPDILRIKYFYTCGNRDALNWIIFTIFKCGNFVSFVAVVSDSSIKKQLAVKFEKFFVDPLKVDADSRDKVNVIYPNPQDLIIKLSDELIEPILVDIHRASSLPPRFGFLSLPSAVLLNILEWLSLSDLACLSISCRQMNEFINASEALWRRKLAKVFKSLPTDVGSNADSSDNPREIHGKCSSLITFQNLYRVRRSTLRRTSRIRI